LPNAVPTGEFASELQRKNEPFFVTTASQGVGVFDMLKAVAKQVLTKIEKRLNVRM
jgi:uncharacterized membrane protein